METTIILILCGAAVISAQLMHPTYLNGMGGMGNQMWTTGMSSGLRPPGYPYSAPGMMQTSQLSSVTYPTWRSHPLFRMTTAPTTATTTTPDKSSMNLPHGVMNIPQVPSHQEVLTHMAMANQNPKPYYDTIADFLYSYEPQKSRQAILTPTYLQGMNLMRASANVGDDCGQDGLGVRWNRDLMEWVY